MAIQAGSASERRDIGAAVLVVLAVTSGVMAPQLAYLQRCAEVLPLLPLLLLNLLYGVLLGGLILGVVQAARQRWPELLGTRSLQVVALLLLPLVLLWWPGLSATEHRAAFLVASTAMLLLMAGTGALLLLRWRPGLGQGLVQAVAVMAAAMVWSLLAARLSSGDRLFAPISFLWGVYLVAALAGWGRLLNHLVLPERRLDWGQRAAWGLALAVSIGGLLNLSWSISRLLVLLLLATGFAALLTGCRLPSRSRLAELARRGLEQPVTVLLILVVVLLAGLQLASSVAGTVDTVNAKPAFDLHDDHQAYLVFPVKMLELGSMGPEPFEGRRMLSMGGQSFLQVLVLAALPMRALHLADSGVALLIIIGLVLGATRTMRIDGRAALLAALLVLSFDHLGMRGNSSSVLTGVVLLLSWFRLWADQVLPAQPSRAAAVLTAITAAALCAVKSVFIPAALVMVAGGTVLQLASSGDRRAVLREAALLCLLVVVLVLPWMISISESSGTLLYPVLGKGFYGGVYTDDFATITGPFEVSAFTYLSMILKQLLSLLPVLLLLACVDDRAPRRPAGCLAAATLVTMVLLVVLGDPNLNRGLNRYCFVLLMAAFLGLLLAALRDTSEGRQALRLGTVAALAIAAVYLLHNQDELRPMYQQMLSNTAGGLGGPSLVSEPEQRAVTDMQATLPPGATLLASLRAPYLLDLRRRQVRIMSLPGMASPPPGIPIDRGGEAVADYLLAHSISCLAYGGWGSQYDLLELTEANIRARYYQSKMRWVMLRYHERYRAAVRELAETRKRLYCNGRIIALDLSQEVTTFIPAEHPQLLSGFREGVWTNGKGIVRDLSWPAGCRFLVLRTMGWRPLGETPAATGLRLVAGDRELPAVGRAPDGFVFSVPEELAGTSSELRLLSSVVDPEQIGAAQQPAIGIDVRAIELAADIDVAGQIIATTRQPLSGPLVPAAVWQRSGFFPDNGWTGEEARLVGLCWPIPDGHRFLVLSLFPVHPAGTGVAEIGARVLVNGIELAPAPGVGDGRSLVFRLCRGLEEINTVHILSPTFVPRKQGGGNDSRSLGIPVRSITTSDTAGG